MPTKNGTWKLSAEYRSTDPPPDREVQPITSVHPACARASVCRDEVDAIAWPDRFGTVRIAWFSTLLYLKPAGWHVAKSRSGV